MGSTFIAEAVGPGRRVDTRGLVTLADAIRAAHALLRVLPGATDLVVRTSAGREAWRNGVLTPLGHDLQREAEAGADLVVV